MYQQEEDFSGNSPAPTLFSSSPSGDPASASPDLLPADRFVFKGGAPGSFRDVVMGGERRPAAAKLPDLLEENLASISLLEGDRLRPSIKFAEKVRNTLRQPWEDGLILSVLGLRVGFLALRDRLCRLWKLQGNFQLLNLGEGFFLAKFDRREDRELVINGGPWMVFDRYLAVSRWSPSFSPATCKIKKTLVWVRLPALGLMYYDEAALRVIASEIGKFVKIDINTLEINRGKFARLCIEVDLELPVVSSVLIDGEWQRVEYEGLHLICACCGCFGHSKKDCPGKVTEELAGNGAGDKVGVDSVVGDKVSQEGVAADPDVEEMGEMDNEEAGNLHLKDTETVPPQPQLGEWVVVSRRQKKDGRTQGKQLNVLKQKDDTSQRREQLSSRSQRSAKGVVSMGNGGGRGKTSAVAPRLLQTRGDDRGHGDIGFKRPRSTEELGIG